MMIIVFVSIAVIIAVIIIIQNSIKKTEFRVIKEIACEIKHATDNKINLHADTHDYNKFRSEVYRMLKNLFQGFETTTAKTEIEHSELRSELEEKTERIERLQEEHVQIMLKMQSYVVNNHDLQRAKKHIDESLEILGRYQISIADLISINDEQINKISGSTNKSV